MNKNPGQMTGIFSVGEEKDRTSDLSGYEPDELLAALLRTANVGKITFPANLYNFNVLVILNGLQVF